MSKPALTPAQWRARLTPEQYRVTRDKGTEPPFSGAYWQPRAQAGIYQCVCCAAPLFDAADQFDAGCGWPSFSQPHPTATLEQLPDASLGMQRTEVLCSQCDAHLGHVFDDGPGPRGLRYCINSVALVWQPK
jgi:peptide-methionine (R)-S-oxide reductase